MNLYKYICMYILIDLYKYVSQLAAVLLEQFWRAVNYLSVCLCGGDSDCDCDSDCDLWHGMN